MVDVPLSASNSNFSQFNKFLCGLCFCTQCWSSLLLFTVASLLHSLLFPFLWIWCPVLASFSTSFSTYAFPFQILCPNGTRFLPNWHKFLWLIAATYMLVFGGGGNHFFHGSWGTSCRTQKKLQRSEKLCNEVLQVA